MQRSGETSPVELFRCKNWSKRNLTQAIYI